jgi:hypothetical protein
MEDRAKSLGNKALAIILGLIAGVLIGLLLLPLIRLGFDEFYEFNFGIKDPGITADRIYIALMIALYFFICDFVASSISTYILNEKEFIINRGTSIVLCIATFFLFITDSYKMKTTDYLDMILTLIAIHSSYYFGSKFIKKIKSKRLQ